MVTATAVDLILAPAQAKTQPPLYGSEHPPPQLTAAIATLALGGAERIVLDWAARCVGRYRVKLIVLRRAPTEWPVPPGVLITRLDDHDPPRVLHALTALGNEIAAAGNPIILCHLLTAAERGALARGGAQPIPVLHNAAIGWIEEAKALANTPRVVTVSHAAARELREAGCRAISTVIHHLPASPVQSAQSDAARAYWRDRWAIPTSATVIGMIGAVKPQKVYTRALRLLASMRVQRDVWLVILGGPIGRDGTIAWDAILAQARRLQLESRLRLPGFVTHAAACLPAFDVLLNTSRYEGLSIATLEALAASLPVVASAVGGQGEVAAPGLTLIAEAEDDAVWLRAINASLAARPQPPAWRGFPSYRLWTLLHVLPRYKPEAGVLFVTANLNAGGAQRSLCNLTRELNKLRRLEIAVCGDSSTDYFYTQLRTAGITVSRSAASRDCFDHAEAVLQQLVRGRFVTMCFWNVDAKVKLLLAKALASAPVRIIDVSPGGYSFEEMQALHDFQHWVAFDEAAYYARLNHLVLKYAGDAPTAVRHKSRVISNGVPVAARRFNASATDPPKIVVSGRIAPTKYVIEIIESMRLLWQTHATAELHVLGTSEQRHADYAHRVIDTIGVDLNQRVFLHGAVFDAPERLGSYHIALVLGEHQGSPNAVLEAMAAGLAVVANDSGGTRELILHERTGLLLPRRDPHTIAAALRRLLDNATFARRLADAGQQHVAQRFSMAQMVRAYRKIM